MKWLKAAFRSDPPKTKRSPKKHLVCPAVGGQITISLPWKGACGDRGEVKVYMTPTHLDRGVGEFDVQFEFEGGEYIGPTE